MQTAKKIVLHTAVDFAIEEQNGRARWRYFDRVSQNFDTGTQESVVSTQLSGTHVKEFRHPYRQHEGVPTINTLMKDPTKYQYEPITVAKIQEFCEYYSADLQEFHLYSQLDVIDKDGKKQIYRAAPYFEGRQVQTLGIPHQSTLP